MSVPELLERVRERRDLPPPEMRRAIRLAAGVSQDAIAAAMDPPVTRCAVHHWEKGDRVPTGDRLRQYGEILRALVTAP